MSFMKPPKPPKPANQPIIAKDSPMPLETDPSLNSLINTGPTGLQRKANVQRTSLIGGV
jgi:hypothetical protein